METSSLSSFFFSNTMAHQKELMATSSSSSTLRVRSKKTPTAVLSSSHDKVDSSGAANTSICTEDAKPEEVVKDNADALKSTTTEPRPRVSSRVAFYPPSHKYWRIGNQWYDFTDDFLDRHPGGKEVLLLARDRFEDATFVFESHHHNYQHARNIIQKYRVSDTELAKNQHQFQVRPARPRNDDKNTMAPQGSLITQHPTHFDKHLDDNLSPQLLPDDAFYSVLRRRVTAYLRSVQCPDGGPTRKCILLFWMVWILWVGLLFLTYTTGRFTMAAVTGVVATWVGAFGHNWVHQPRYKMWNWDLMSLDPTGFSSEGWFRDHNLHHHMYTNTPWDHHFRGIDPILITDPTVPRNVLQTNVFPYCLHVILAVAPYFNHLAHFVELVQGNEVWSIGKCFFGGLHALFWMKWGFLHGVGLMFTITAVVGNYFFTLALVNHNTLNAMDMKQRNGAKDWGIAQLHSSADWGVDLSFVQAMIYCWLNFHTVHHLFPRVDMCHHPAIHQILVEVCAEFDIPYQRDSSFISLYGEMIETFRHPQSPWQEILVYAGGI